MKSRQEQASKILEKLIAEGHEAKQAPIGVSFRPPPPASLLMQIAELGEELNKALKDRSKVEEK